MAEAESFDKNAGSPAFFYDPAPMHNQSTSARLQSRGENYNQLCTVKLAIVCVTLVAMATISSCEVCA